MFTILSSKPTVCKHHVTVRVYVVWITSHPTRWGLKVGTTHLDHFYRSDGNCTLIGTLLEWQMRLGDNT